MNPPRVLIVDDDPEIRESMRMVLEDEGYHVREAADGVAALDELHRDQQPCVVLLDLMMPRMNGWEFLGAAASDP
jgi:CheY-like chemotaxis protein